MASLLRSVLCGAVAFSLSAARVSLADDTVTIDLRGRVRAACTVSMHSARVDLGDIMDSAARTIPIHFYCNAPFTYEMRSRYGGLRHVRISSASPHFRVVVPYVVVTRLPTSAGDIVDTCASGDLAAEPVRCRMSDSGSGISIDREASLTVTFPDDTRVPLAGRYRDVISLAFSPRY